MVALTPTPDQSGIFTVLRAFLLAVMPDGMDVIQGQVNRVPEPAAADFIVMTPGRNARLATNINDETDSLFTASIAGTIMTVSSITLGTIPLGNQLFGTGILAGTGATRVLTQTSGSTGGTGVYTISPTQSMSSSPVSAGDKSVIQKTEVTIQLDVHGPNSMDNAQIISTLFRDEYATEFFATLSSVISPLFADDPRQVPFLNAENQYEDRWIVEANLQVDPSVFVPQQFADTLTVETISVDATFPPS